MNPRKKLSIIILMVLAVVSTLTFMGPLCGFMFKCGCVWNWAGAATHCNIHNASPPHCPWCAHGTVGFILPAVGLTLGQFASGWLTLRLNHGLILAGLVALGSLLPVGFALGWLTILITTYPHFLTFH